MKKIVFVVLFVLITQCISAITSGTDYIVSDIPRCYGPVTIKLTGQTPFLMDEYSITKFTKTQITNKEDKWTYSCNNKIGEHLPVIIQTLNNTENTYNVYVEYYLNPYISIFPNKTMPSKEEIENDNNRRTLVYTNLEFTKLIPKKKSLLESFPSISGSIWIIIFIGIIIVLGVIAVIIIYKIFFKSEDEVVSEHTLSKKKQEPTDEEVFEYIRNNVR